jgi:tRNA (cmo5U34)-methyltransferase
VFVLQFLHKDARKALLRSIYDGLNEGGALILCEKEYCEQGNFQDMFTSTYYDYKKQSFTEKEIFDKERALRTMLKPNTHQANLELLCEAGFQLYKIDTFYKYFHFRGMLCIK